MAKPKGLKRESDRFPGRWDNVKTTIWFVAVFELLIILLAIIVGHTCGFQNALVAFIIFGVLFGIILLSLVSAVAGGDLLLRWLRKK